MSIALSRHPLFSQCWPNFELWRACYAADDYFLEKYLRKFSQREDVEDFTCRRAVTPIPSFAASAINDIKNAIFQRLADVLRNGGSENYQRSVAGEGLGIDRRGCSMNAFIGQKLISELLVMGQVGVWVDNTQMIIPDLSDAQGALPYLYPYKREDILNWELGDQDHPSEFKSVLLRDCLMKYDELTRLPVEMVERKRLAWIDDQDGLVHVRYLNDKDEDLEESRTLQLNRIPFVMLDIGDSLIRPVCRHQIALLNLTSSDVWYALKSNFPFYTEQRDLRSSGPHLKLAATDGSAMAGDQSAEDNNIEVGTASGRAYGQGLERPGFIHPSSEPLKASMALQDKLERDIRKLVNLTVSQLGQQSAESKQMDQTSLEAGLSFIGLVLENAERKIASHWAAYERTQKIATVKYPDRYSLKTDSDRIQESDELSNLVFKVPGRTAKREIMKLVCHTLLSGKVNVETIQKIDEEIDGSPYLTSDPKTIIEASQAGLVGEQTASKALGFPDDEYLTAREDHAARARRVAQAQASVTGNMGARGVDDLSAAPAQEAAAEKEQSRNRDLSVTTQSRVRGAGHE
jgi:hypothetical protein